MPNDIKTEATPGLKKFKVRYTLEMEILAPNALAAEEYGIECTERDDLLDAWVGTEIIDDQGNPVPQPPAGSLLVATDAQLQQCELVSVGGFGSEADAAAADND
jgi:hypothetical protein